MSTQTVHGHTKQGLNTLKKAVRALGGRAIRRGTAISRHLPVVYYGGDDRAYRPAYR